MAEATLHHLTIPQYVADYEQGHLDGREFVVDVLTNLRHFAQTYAVDFGDALETSLMHYDAETKGEDFV